MELLKTYHQMHSDRSEHDSWVLVVQIENCGVFCINVRCADCRYISARVISPTVLAHELQSLRELEFLAKTR